MEYAQVLTKDQSIRKIQIKFNKFGGVSCYTKADNLSLISKQKPHRLSCRCELCEFREENGYKK